jgi:hypothetical protein
MEAVWPSAIADPLLDGLWGIAGRMARGHCDADLRSLAASLRADRAALQAYLTNAQRALQGMDVRALARGQEEFGSGVEALVRATERCEAAVRAREAGWVRIGDAWGRWARDAPASDWAGPSTREVVPPSQTAMRPPQRGLDRFLGASCRDSGIPSLSRS